MKRFDLDTWQEILVTITRNKTRSLLTAFGIFWGIFMLVALMGGAQGLQDILSRQFQGFATNSGFLGSNQTSKAYKGFQQGRFWDLENLDVDRIRKNVDEVDIKSLQFENLGEINTQILKITSKGDGLILSHENLELKAKKIENSGELNGKNLKLVFKDFSSQGGKLTSDKISFEYYTE